MSRAPVILVLAAACAGLADPATAESSAAGTLTLCRNEICMEDRGEPTPGRLLTYGVDFGLGDHGFAAVDCVERIIAAPGAQALFVPGSLPDLLCRLRGYETPARTGAAAGEGEGSR